MAGVQADGPQPDALAEEIRKLGLDLGRSTQGDGEADDCPAPDLADLPYAATMVIETARWRLLRVASTLRLTAST